MHTSSERIVKLASSDMATIAILGTMDSKGAEHAFVAERIRERGHRAFIIDVGTLGEPTLKPDITRDEVAATGSINLAALQGRQDRGESEPVKESGDATAAIVPEPPCYRAIRRSQVERSVRALLVEVADVDAENVLELAATEDQEPVETLPAHAADPAFGVGVRVRA